jgi:hypothetical protein
MSKWFVRLYTNADRGFYGRFCRRAARPVIGYVIGSVIGSEVGSAVGSADVQRGL